MIDMQSTARKLSKDLGIPPKKLQELLEKCCSFWAEELSGGDEVMLTGIGRIHPLRWKLGPAQSLYRTRVGKTPLNRKYTWVLRIDGDINLKAKLRKAMMR